MTDDHTLADGDLEDGPSRTSVVEVDDILGEVIDGRYEVVSRLGSGGMGFVWEARDLVRDGAPVVLKTLRPELVNNEKTAERFSREAMASASLDHENVIRVLGHGVTGDYGAYYVMERLVGMDLGAAIAHAGAPLELERTLDIAAHVASALGAAHSRGIVHRDLKPENVYLAERDGGEIVKVLDFGLARLLDAGNKLTETGAVIGTPRYMAPEQCQGEKADTRADVYSLALVMHEMLTARQPYASFGTYEILGKKMFEEMEAPSALEPPVLLDPRVEAFLMRCLSKTQEDRPRDGAAMLEAIEALRADLRANPEPPAPVTAPISEHPSPVSSPPSPPSAPPPSSPISVHPSPRSSPPSSPPSSVAPEVDRPSAPMAVAAGSAPRRSGVPIWLIAALTALFVTAAGVLSYALLFASELEPTPPPRAQPAPVVAPRVAPAPAVRPAALHVVHVTSEPAGAEVRGAGGTLLGRTPLELRLGADVEDGAMVELTLDGHAPRDIVLSRGVPTAHVRLHQSP